MLTVVVLYILYIINIILFINNISLIFSYEIISKLGIYLTSTQDLTQGQLLKAEILSAQKCLIPWIGPVGTVFANFPGDLSSIPGRVIPKTLKMVLDISLLNTQQYKVHIEGKVEQSVERSSALSYTSV